MHFAPCIKLVYRPLRQLCVQHARGLVSDAIVYQCNKMRKKNLAKLLNLYLLYTQCVVNFRLTDHVDQLRDDNIYFLPKTE